MSEHILLQKAKRYSVSGGNLYPQDCYYDATLGYWIDNDSGVPMMMSSKHKQPTSKKCDIETGEDQKGE